MSVDIQDITAEVEDIIDTDAKRAARRAPGPDPADLREDIRRHRARLRWIEERLEA